MAAGDDLKKEDIDSDDEDEDDDEEETSDDESEQDESPSSSPAASPKPEERKPRSGTNSSAESSENEKGKGKQKKQKKSGIFFRMKKKVGGAMATSAVGKAALRKFLPNEIVDLLKTLKYIIAKESGSKKKAKRVENTIIRLTVKANMYSNKGLLSINDWLKADRPLRKAFDLIYDLYDAFGDPEAIAKSEIKFQQVEQLFRGIEKILTDLLTPLFRPRTMQRLKFLFDEIGSAAFFKRLWEKTALKNEVFLLVSSMNKYTQFCF